MRRPTDADRADVAAALDVWAAGLLSTLERETGCTLLIHGDTQPYDLHLATPEVTEDVLAIPWDVDDAGLPLGPLIHGRWRPSLAAAVLATPHAPGRTCVLGAKTVQPFLYGRRLDGGAVERLAPDAAPGDYVFVVDPGRRPLGVARLAPDGRGLDPVRDLGWYLREGG